MGALDARLFWLRLAIIVGVVLPSAIFGGAVWLSRLEAARGAQARLERLAAAAEDRVARVMERNDVVLQQMLLVLKDDDDDGLRARERQLHELARAIVLRLPYIHSLSVWSRDGRLLASSVFSPVPSSLESGEWQYLGWDAVNAAGGSGMRLLFDAATGEPILRIAKERTVSTGRSGGRIDLALSTAHFTAMFREVADGEDAVRIALLDSEGTAVASWPQALFTSVVPEEGGRFTEKLRHAVSRSVGNQPLSVVAWQDSAAVFADWKRQSLILGAIVLPTTLALVLVAWFALVRTEGEIDARRRLDEEFQQRSRAEDTLRHAQRLDALGQLAGGIAHDFNNLLTVVGNSAELLARMVPEAAQRPELASIQHAVDGGAKLTRRLLGFSRRQAMRPERVSVGSALAGMLDLLRATAGSGVTITLDVRPDTPQVEVDAVEFETALINLVANARDAMHHQGRIDVRAARGKDEHKADGGASSHAVISVADTGEGMSVDIAKRVFEPFFTTKPVGVGTGLGLSQVHAFCTQSGGSVRITSAPGAGTTISMVLPGRD
jgi:two-component system, NtrC family, sensor kinase